MQIKTISLGAALVAALLAFAPATPAADHAHDAATKEFMKKYHKAPKGVDPVCKKAADGKATPAEIKALIAGYRAMTKAKPVKGDAASWKEKTERALAAAEALEKGAPDAGAKFKEAINCKACHSAHKPD